MTQTFDRWTMNRYVKTHHNDRYPEHVVLELNSECFIPCWKKQSPPHALDAFTCDHDAIVAVPTLDLAWLEVEEANNA